VFYSSSLRFEELSERFGFTFFVIVPAVLSIALGKRIASLSRGS